MPINNGGSNGGGGGGGGSGTVDSVAVISANGLAGNVANPTTTPAITLSTTVTGIVKGNGTTLSAAVAADFPTLNQNTTGNAATATNVQNGSANAIVYQTAASTTGFSKNTGGQAVLAQSNGGAPFWQSYGTDLPYELAQYDQNTNLFSNNLLNGSLFFNFETGVNIYQLDSSSPKVIFLTSTDYLFSRSLVMPSSSRLVAGFSFLIIDNSFGRTFPVPYNTTGPTNSILPNQNYLDKNTCITITWDGTAWNCTTNREIAINSLSTPTVFNLTQADKRSQVFAINTVPAQVVNLPNSGTLQNGLYYNLQNFTTTNTITVNYNDVETYALLPNNTINFYVIDGVWEAIPDKLMLDPVVKTASFSVPAYNAVYLLDSSSVAFAVTLGGTPFENTQVAFLSQNDTTTNSIEINNGQTGLTLINTKVKQYVVLTYINNAWVVTTQLAVDNFGNTYTSLFSNLDTPTSTQVMPWSYINYKITQAVQNPFSSLTANANILLTDGVINVDASSNNITLTLPQINTLTYYNGQKTWQIRRLDNTNNTVTVQVTIATGDTIFNGTTATTYVIQNVKGNNAYVSLEFNANGTPFNSTFYID